MRALARCVLVMVAALGALSLTPNTSAGSDPRQESPAIWVVDAPMVESVYPDGLVFRLRAQSNAGEIERARLLWYRPVLRPGATRHVQVEEASVDPEAGELVAIWRPSGMMMLPPWAVISYHWELRDSAGNTYTTEPQTAEYADTTREWTHSESQDAIVFAQGLPGEIEALVLDAMAAQRDTYEAVWGAALPYKPRIVLFGDYDAWLEWRTADRNTSDTSIVVGQTFDAWGVIAQVMLGHPSEQAYRELAYSVVLHELEHLYQSEFLAGRRRMDVPGWFYEGDATFFELEQSYPYLGRVRAMAATGELPPLLVVNIADAPSVSGDDPRLGYDIGYSFFEWLRQSTGGLEAHAAIMALLADDVPFFEALEQALGRTTTEIEREWRLWLGASEAAPTLIPTWTPPPFLVPPTPMQFGK